jgi:hypothetical protein
VREDKPREFVAVPVVLVLLGILFAVALLAALGVWGWVLFGLVAVVGIAVVFVLLARRPSHPSELDAPPAAARRAAAPDGAFRVVVVADDACTAPALAEAVAGHAAGRKLEVLVVAPALGSRLSRWTGDDRARDEAARTLADTLGALEGAGIPASGELGAEDPIQAADDALRDFPADELVFATHPDAEANWLERDVLEVARTRYDVPVAHVALDPTTGPERSQEPT